MYYLYIVILMYTVYTPSKASSKASSSCARRTRRLRLVVALGGKGGEYLHGLCLGIYGFLRRPFSTRPPYKKKTRTATPTCIPICYVLVVVWVIAPQVSHREKEICSGPARLWTVLDASPFMTVQRRSVLIPRCTLVTHIYAQ